MKNTKSDQYNDLANYGSGILKGARARNNWYRLSVLMTSFCNNIITCIVNGEKLGGHELTYQLRWLLWPPNFSPASNATLVIPTEGRDLSID